MEKAAFAMRIKEGCMDEYIRMHDNIWPEIQDALKRAGRSNYSIWRTGNMVFGYYEVEDYEVGRKVIETCEAFKKWNQIVKEMLDPEDRILNGKISPMDMIFYQK
jgi:L-rhamnose mutarotase